MIQLFHVGYQKCGSTFLQRRFFKAVDGINYIPVNGLAYGLIKSDDLFYDGAATAAEMAERFAIPGMLNVLSHEQFICNYSHITRTCDRLRALSPGARVLIVIRSQAGLLKSMYQQRIRGGFGFTFPRYVTEFCQRDQTLPGLRFNRVIDLYRDRFGADNVRVEFFERFFNEAAMRGLLAFLGLADRRFAADLGEKVNVRYSPFSHHVQLLVNKLQGTTLQGFDPEDMLAYRAYRKLAQPIDRLISRVAPRWALRFDERTEEFIRLYYDEDNRALAAMFPGMDLRTLGYHYAEEVRP